MVRPRARFPGWLLIAVVCLVPWTPAHADDPPGTYAGKDAAWWVEELKDRDGAKAALVAFKKIGRPALEVLGKALQSQNQTVRYGAARALKGMGISLAPIVADLAAALAKQETPSRGALLGLLRKAGRAAAPYIDTVVPLIRSTDRDTANAALGVLSSLAPESRAVLPEILAAAKGGPERTRRGALAAAIAIDPSDERLVPILEGLLACGSDSERYHLVRIARDIQVDVPGFADLVAGCTRDKAPKVRRTAAQIYIGVVLRDGTRIGELTAMLTDDVHDVRSSAAHALSELGTRAAPAVPALMEALAAKDPSAHIAVIRALAAIGADARVAAPLVLEAAERSDASRDLLGAAHAFLASDVETTIDALGSESPRARRMAVEIVAGWSTDRWIAAMPEVLDPVSAVLVTTSESSYRENRILDALGRLALDHPPAQTVLLGMARASSEALRDHAARLVGARPENVALLIELLGSSSADERAFAYTALSRTQFAAGDLAQGLWALLHDEREPVRDLIGRMLVTQGGWFDHKTLEEADAKALARAAARLLIDPQARARAAGQLGLLGPYAVPHLQALAALMAEDSLQSVGAIAARTLWSVGQTGDDALRIATVLLLDAFVSDDPVRAACAAHGLVLPVMVHDSSLPLGARRVTEYDALLLERLPALVTSPKKTVHFNAVEAAGQMGPRAKPLAPTLIRIVEEPIAGSHVDAWAVDALRKIAPADPDVVGMLLRVGPEPRRRDGWSAYEHALRAGGETTIRMVADALADANTETRLLLLPVLAHFRERASSVRDAVRPLLDDPDVRVSAAAKRTLKALGDL